MYADSFMRWLHTTVELNLNRPFHYDVGLMPNAITTISIITRCFSQLT